MSLQTAHRDTFTRDHLPPDNACPEFLFELPELQYPERLNCGAVLLDEAVTEGYGDETAVIGNGQRWTYSALAERANRIAHVLVTDLQLVPGNRVLLRGPNGPDLIAAWLAVIRAGGIAVTTMPLLRTRELEAIVLKARIDIAICHTNLTRELTSAAENTGLVRRRVSYGDSEFEGVLARHPTHFELCDTARDDVALLAFTSGTSGDPKATMHFHRDVLAMTDVFARHLLKTAPSDVYTGSPPLGFTFGLGALLAFPLRFRAATAPLKKPSAQTMLEHVSRVRATCLFTAPTAYSAMLPLLPEYDISSLRQCVSAGEHLSRSTWDAWYARTGLQIIDGLGSTEMIHIFISAAGDEIRPGATGKVLPGYRACVLDSGGNVVGPGTPGLLAVKGPTGCRYLEDDRQRSYVRQGWNVTGDIFVVDRDGYFWYQGRADDMIISGGYNISPVEVERALVEHPAVLECAAVAAPDPDRGRIVKAYVVLRDGYEPNTGLTKTLQDFVKTSIAPYKYPRAIEFVTELPKTATGKLQRSALRERASQVTVENPVKG